MQGKGVTGRGRRQVRGRDHNTQVFHRRRCTAEGAGHAVEGQPSRQRRATGQGRGVGQGVTGIDIDEVAHRYHEQQRRADVDLLGSQHSGHTRRIVGTVNGDGQGRSAGGRRVVGHSVGEGIGQGIGVGTQGLYRRIAVIDHVGVSAVGVEGQAAISPGAGSAHRTARNGGDGLGVAAMIVVEHVASRVESRSRVGDPTRFGGTSGIGNGNRCRVAADRDGECLFQLVATAIGGADTHRIGTVAQGRRI